jgi:hypothetical protein
MNGYITKPINKETLLNEINRQVSRGLYQRNHTLPRHG